MSRCRATQTATIPFLSIPSFLFLVLFVTTIPFIRCTPQNVTCDDQLGCDLPGGAQGPSIQFLPESGWTQGSTCTGCKIQPDPSLAYNGTWHDTTLDLGKPGPKTFNITFIGTAIYTFFIMPNNVASFDEGVTILANMSVYLDDAYEGEILHEPQGGSQFIYNFPGYSVSGLSNDKHVLSVSANNEAASSNIEFDYFIYTTEQILESSGPSLLPIPTVSSSSGNSDSSSIPTSEDGGSEAREKSIVGPVIGGVLGGVAFFIILGGAFVIYKRSQLTDQIDQTAVTRRPIRPFWVVHDVFSRKHGGQDYMYERGDSDNYGSSSTEFDQIQDREKRIAEWTRTVRAGPDGTDPPPAYAWIFGSRTPDNKHSNNVGGSASNQSSSESRSRDGASGSSTSENGPHLVMERKRRRG